MTYDHNKKAGNQGDVVKHTALIAAAGVLITESNGTFQYADTFAGYPINLLRSDGEWLNGIETLWRSGRVPATSAVNFLRIARTTLAWRICLTTIGVRLTRRIFQRTRLDLRVSTQHSPVILLPCQIIRAGRRITYRLLGYNPWLPDFFAAFEKIQRLAVT